MFLPMCAKKGAVLSAVTFLIGAGLLFPPAASIAAPALKAVPLAAGGEHSLAVASDGMVWHWGLSAVPANGTVWYWDASMDVRILQPVRIDKIDSVVATAGGDPMNLALKSDGTVWSIGYPGVQQVERLNGIVAVDARQGYGLALKADGTVWQFDQALAPMQVPGLTDVIAVAMGAYYSSIYTYADNSFNAVALKEDGTVWTWADLNSAQAKQELTNVVAIAAGFDHHLALKSDGTVWAWGSNTCGQTGGNVPTSWAGGSPDWTARKVEGIENVTAISANGGEHFFSFGHSLALKSDGTVWEWGCDGTAVFQPKPTKVAGVNGVLAIVAGGEHSLALKNDGTVWAWGWNYYGQLGNGTRTYTFSGDSVVSPPVQVLGLPPLTLNYFNEHGQPYNNEEYSYFYNAAEKQWYRGSKGGQITPIVLPPWEEKNVP